MITMIILQLRLLWQFDFDGPFYGFETMTLVPLETKLIDVEMLTDEQVLYMAATRES